MFFIGIFLMGTYKRKETGVGVMACKIKKQIEINAFLNELKLYRVALSKRSLKTIRGQAINGDLIGAKKGLRKLLKKENRIYQ